MWMASAREDQTGVNIRCAERVGKREGGAGKASSPILLSAVLSIATGRPDHH